MIVVIGGNKQTIFGRAAKEDVLDVQFVGIAVIRLKSETNKWLVIQFCKVRGSNNSPDEVL